MAWRRERCLPIPAATLKDVFRELAKRRDVEICSLVVDAKALNVEHPARDEFEKVAVRAITLSAEDFESAEVDVDRRIGVIAVTSVCLKCHILSRTSTQARTAGLIISMPLKRD